MTYPIGKLGDGGEFRSISHLSDYDWNLRDAVNEGFLSTPAHKAGPIEANIAEVRYQ